MPGAAVMRLSASETATAKIEAVPATSVASPGSSSPEVESLLQPQRRLYHRVYFDRTVPHAAALLNRAYPFIGGDDILGAVAFGKPHGLRGAGDYLFKVVLKKLGVRGVDTHRYKKIFEIKIFKETGDHPARAVLFRKGDRVFEVQQHAVGAEDRRVLDHSGSVSRDV